jgi:hypothetical protein
MPSRADTEERRLAQVTPWSRLRVEIRRPKIEDGERLEPEPSRGEQAPEPMDLRALLDETGTNVHGCRSLRSEVPQHDVTGAFEEVHAQLLGVQS